jgi:glutaredoxin 3
VADQAHSREWLEAAPETTARAPDSLGDGADAPAPRCVQVKDPVSLAKAQRAQHDRVRLDRATHAIQYEVMSNITLYTTEPCGYCRQAKALLDKRGLSYDEINLAKDADGRAELAERTGMMTFPQVIIDDQLVGGFTELVSADRSGLLAELLAQ